MLGTAPYFLFFCRSAQQVRTGDAGQPTSKNLAYNQGCQMVCFQTKNPNLGRFWRTVDWKMFKYFMTIWNILWRFGIFYEYLVYFVFIWNIFSGFGIMYQEKSGNPAYNLSHM
jgi:hypothetical protein